MIKINVTYRSYRLSEKSKFLSFINKMFKQAKDTGSRCFINRDDIYSVCSRIPIENIKLTVMGGTRKGSGPCRLEVTRNG